MGRSVLQRGRSPKPLVIVALAGSVIWTGSSAASTSDQRTQSAWQAGVARVCAGARLFEGRHSIGTEQGAIAVARDIRASTARRLARIEALDAVPERPLLAQRWLHSQRRLSRLFARSYLEIWHAVAAANSPTARAKLPRILERMLHRPDGERAYARHLEAQLDVPDCTGGDNTDPTPSIVHNP